MGVSVAMVMVMVMPPFSVAVVVRSAKHHGDHHVEDDASRGNDEHDYKAGGAGGAAS